MTVHARESELRINLTPMLDRLVEARRAQLHPAVPVASVVISPHSESSTATMVLVMDAARKVGGRPANLAEQR